MIFNRKPTETDNKKRDAKQPCTTLFIVKQAAFPQNWFMALAPHGQICHKLPTACEFSVQTPEGESGLIIYYAGGQKACLTSEEAPAGKTEVSLSFHAKPSIKEQKRRENLAYNFNRGLYVNKKRTGFFLPAVVSVFQLTFKTSSR